MALRELAGRAVHTALDTALDRSVVLGYSRIGYRVRATLWAADPPPDALRGKVVVVTGAGSGIGTAIATGVARLGAEVRMVVRNPERGEPAAEQVRSAVPGAQVFLEPCDVSDVDAIAVLTRDLATRVPRIHALVHNAGLMPPRRQVSAQGHELALATHVLGPYELTTRLAPNLDRVVFVSSGGMYAQKLDMADPEYRAGDYRGSTAYARTKRAQVVLTELLAEELAPKGVVVHSMHPGWADTPGVRRSLPRFRAVTRLILRDSAQGADTVVWLCAADEPGRSTGLFWHDRRPRPTHYLPWTRESGRDREKLLELCRSAAVV